MKGYSASYLAKRLFSAVLTLWVALTINFLLPRAMGGDPATYIAAQNAMGSPEYARTLSVQFGLDKSLPEQYVRYLGQLMKGNLGVSYTTFPIPVAQIITRAMPWTLYLVITATLISFALAWVLGTVCALKQNTWFDNLLVGTSFYIQSVPYFWVAMLLVMSFGYYLNIFPMSHALPTGLGEVPWYRLIGPIAFHSFLPILSLVIVSLAGRMVVLRSNILQIFSEDYILLAQAKGLKRGTILGKYAFRNAMLPSFTGLMLSLGIAVSGAITTEIIFSYPGIGLTIMNAILGHDYPLVQGCFAIIAVSIVTMNLLADLIYPLLDPRVALS
jgi:peptide/nickel transport system permease protein